jgi:predicted AAA+ superfamily ATPase
MIFRGSFPRLYENQQVRRDTYYESYIRTYLERDIRDLTQVADEGAFYKFLCVAAARTATTVNYNAMASECGITAPTAKQWLSLLVTSGLVVLIEPYFNNLLKRVVKSPRMYFMDTGLCTYLTKWNDLEALEAGAMSGEFFETWVVSEVYKSFINNGKRPPLYYYRDSNNKEIDLIIYQNNTLFPIEIKKSAFPSKATKNFNALDPVTKEGEISGEMRIRTNIGTGAVVCLCSDLLPVNKKNWYVPAWLI